MIRTVDVDVMISSTIKLFGWRTCTWNPEAVISKLGFTRPETMTYIAPDSCWLRFKQS